MPPLDNYFRSQQAAQFAGHPVVGFDDMNVGAPGMLALWLARQRARRMGIRGEDDLGADVVADLGAELEADIAGDDDDDDDDDDDIDLGASTERLEDKLAKKKQKRSRILAKMRSARTEIFRRRHKKRLAKIDDQIENLERQIRRRTREDREAAGGAPERDTSTGPRSGPLDNPMIYDSQGRYVGIQRAGRYQPLPMKFSGQIDAVGAFAASTPARSQVLFTAQTDQITYADFFVRGFRVGAYVEGTDGTNRFTNNSFPLFGQLRIVITGFQVDGFSNLLYDDQVIELGGAFGTGSVTNVIDGLRSNSKLARNNVLTVNGFVMNPFAIPASNTINFNLTVEALVDTSTDDLYGNYDPRRPR